MIVPMKRLTLVCMAKEGALALEKLRGLGCVQVDLAAAGSPAWMAAKEKLSDAERAVRLVAKAAKDAAAAGIAPDASAFDTVKTAGLAAEVLARAETRAQLISEAEALRRTVTAYAPFGDFDPALAQQLSARGLAVTLFKEPVAAALPTAAGGYVQTLATAGHTAYRVLVAPAEAAATWPTEAERVALPPARLASLRAELVAKEASAQAALAALAGAQARVRAIVEGEPALKDAVAFAAAEESLGVQGPLAWIEGWMPADSLPSVRAQAVSSAWGICVRDARPDEHPPVLIRPPKLFRPVVALFQGLGIAPAYSETDVSVPFMCYFSLFFAMLVGDGAYGTLFLAATLWFWHKTKPKAAPGERVVTHRPRVVRSWLTLMTVFSSATILWGLLSNTWFGAGIPWCAHWPTVEWLADPSYNNMMLLCFTIGVSHLMLARLWNGLSKLNDTSCLAEFGWAGVLLTMYLVTNSIVGIFHAFPSWGYWVGGVSAALVFGFTVKPHELKTRGIELGMLPLNIMSALGDIISYVRLFAVGLASVQVAANFNHMATGLVTGADAIWAKALMSVAMVAILVVGHGLNLAMAGLSILVHAVRLNTLEFSNHKGISWAGSAFSPFRKNS